MFQLDVPNLFWLASNRFTPGWSSQFDTVEYSSCFVAAELIETIEWVTAQPDGRLNLN